MTTPYISQTQYGKNEVFGLQVSRGQIQGHTAVIVFGYNPDVDTAEESVWPDGGTVPHPTVASVLKVSSSSANDTSAGTGARTVYIEGLNGDYAVVSETVILNGQTAVNTVNSYLYVNAFYVVTVGSGGANAGDINVGTGVVTAGVPAVLYDMIAIGYNNFLKQHGPDGILRVGAVSTVNNSAADYLFETPYMIPEKNCVGASAIGAASNNAVSSYFNIILIKNSTGY